MSSRSRRIGAAVVACAVVIGGGSFAAARRAQAHDATTLRVCADPNNLPFSNEREQGFENAIARIIAQDQGARLAYRWWPQRRGFVRNTLKAGDCDLIMGVPTSLDMTSVTRPYYRSTYVFVTRTDRHLDVRSFDDSVLRRLRVGVHMMGDDYANSPAVIALARRGLAKQLVPYLIYGDYSHANPPSNLIEAVKSGAVDVAVAWGPMAGYFARLSETPLTLVPVSPAIELPFLPFVYDIGIGVRHGDTTRRNMLDGEIARNRDTIARILASYGVPIVGPASVRAQR